MNNEITKSNRCKVRVTVVSKLRNAAMHAAAKKAGSQSALAKILGVYESEVSKWCNMQACIPISPQKGWDQERIDDVESKLIQLTGLSLESIFPDELRKNVAFMRSPKIVEQTIELESDAMARLVESHARRTDVRPIEVAERSELASDVSRALSELPDREREIIERRYLLSQPGEPLEDVAKHFRITKERVRQLEMKAMRKIAAGSCAGRLLSHISQEHGELE